MNVALIQMSAGNNKDKNVAKAVSFVEKAAKRKAGFILLPEMFHYRGKKTKKFLWDNVAERIPGPSLKPLMLIARRYKTFILAGSIYEKGTTGKNIYNTSVLIAPDGRISGKYRKNHLFKVKIGSKEINEERYLSPGKKKSVVSVNRVKVGLSVCFDIRFPEMYQYYTQKGCAMCVVPAAFTRETGKAHWEALLRARAIENQCFILAPNQVGLGAQGVQAFGNSMIIDPWGSILARGDASSEIILTKYIKINTIRKIRQKMPLNR